MAIHRTGLQIIENLNIKINRLEYILNKKIRKISIKIKLIFNIKIH